MRILFVTHYSALYGANLSLLRLIVELRRLGVDSIVLLPRKGKICEEFEKEKIPYIVQYFAWWEYEKKRGNWKYLCLILREELKNIYRAFRLRQSLVHENIDIIHSNGSVFDFGAVLHMFLRKPHVWHLREFGRLDYGLEFVYPRWLVKRIFDTSHCVAISQAVRSYYLNRYISPRNLCVIYNGVLEANKQNEHDNHCVQFCCVGLISEKKNQILILEAAAFLIKLGYTNFVVNIIGDGEKQYVTTLQRYVEENKAEHNVKFWGFRSDIYNTLSTMDVGLMTSRNEAFGRVTIEYMMNECAVIASNTGANKELINHGEDGFLFEDNDVKDLADKMRKLLDDRNLMLAMGHKAKKKAEKQFNAKLNAKKILDIYKGLMK